MDTLAVVTLFSPEGKKIIVNVDSSMDEKLRGLGYQEHIVEKEAKSVDETDEEFLEDMSKKALVKYAQDMYGLELDLKTSKANLIKEIESQEESDDE